MNDGFNKIFNLITITAVMARKAVVICHRWPVDPFHVDAWKFIAINVGKPRANTTFGFGFQTCAPSRVLRESMPDLGWAFNFTGQPVDHLAAEALN